MVLTQTSSYAGKTYMPYDQHMLVGYVLYLIFTTEINSTNLNYKIKVKGNTVFNLKNMNTNLKNMNTMNDDRSLISTSKPEVFDQNNISRKKIISLLLIAYSRQVDIKF